MQQTRCLHLCFFCSYNGKGCSFRHFSCSSFDRFACFQVRDGCLNCNITTWLSCGTVGLGFGLGLGCSGLGLVAWGLGLGLGLAETVLFTSLAIVKSVMIMNIFTESCLMSSNQKMILLCFVVIILFYWTTLKACSEKYLDILLHTQK